MIELTVHSVLVSLISNQRIVLLQQQDQERYLPIWIGPFEADAIALELSGASIARPLTHDLIKNLLDTLEAEVCMVIIHDLRDSTFYGQIILKWQENTLEIDSRPSDAIAVALRANAPIFVSDEVIDEAGIKAQQDPTVH